MDTIQILSTVLIVMLVTGLSAYGALLIGCGFVMGVVEAFARPWREEIYRNGVRYITRYILARNRLFRIYVHQIHTPDPDPHPHCHPWEGVAIILRGGYIEQLGETIITATEGTIVTRRHFAPAINRLRTDVYHRIRAVEVGTWTVTFAGPRRGDWAFLVNGRRIDAATYLDANGGAA